VKLYSSTERLEQRLRDAKRDAVFRFSFRTAQVPIFHRSHRSNGSTVVSTMREIPPLSLWRQKMGSNGERGENMTGRNMHPRPQSSLLFMCSQ
jgi:hypothetical protein